MKDSLMCAELDHPPSEEEVKYYTAQGIDVLEGPWGTRLLRSLGGPSRFRFDWGDGGSRLMPTDGVIRSGDIDLRAIVKRYREIKPEEVSVWRRGKMFVSVAVELTDQKELVKVHWYRWGADGPDWPTGGPPVEMDELTLCGMKLENNKLSPITDRFLAALVWPVGKITLCPTCDAKLPKATTESTAADTASSTPVRRRS